MLLSFFGTLFFVAIGMAVGMFVERREKSRYIDRINAKVSLENDKLQNELEALKNEISSMSDVIVDNDFNLDVMEKLALENGISTNRSHISYMNSGLIKETFMFSYVGFGGKKIISPSLKYLIKRKKAEELAIESVKEMTKYLEGPR